MPNAQGHSQSFDVLVGLGGDSIAVAMLLTADDPVAAQPDFAAYLLLASGALALAWRRRFPAWVLAVPSVVTFVNLGLDYPGGPGTVVPLIALYSAAAAGHRWLALLFTAAFAGGDLLFRVLVEGELVVAVTFTSALYTP